MAVDLTDISLMDAHGARVIFLTTNNAAAAPVRVSFLLRVRVVVMAFAAALSGCQGGANGRVHTIFQSAAAYHERQGQQLLAQGDYSEARRRFEFAERLDAPSASSQAGLGQIAERNGHLEDAISHYRMALKMDPENAAYAAALGDCLMRLAATSLERTTLLESAIRAYRHALTLAPSDYSAIVGLAQCYRQLGEYDRAIEALRHAQRIDSSSSQVHILLAELHETSHRYEAAMDEYKLALKLDRDDPAVHNRLAELDLKMAEIGKQKGTLARERAAAHYRRSLQIDPNQRDVRRALAELPTVRKQTASGTGEPAP